MGFYFESSLTEFIVVVVFLEILMLLYFYNSYSYWYRRKVPYVKPIFPFGNIKGLVFKKETFGVLVLNIYKELKEKGVKYGGFYMFAKPVFMPIDPDVVKQIMIKDFNYFQDRGVFVDEVNDPLSAHLFAIGGQTWRNLRNKLSPTFTSGKMKMMFQTLAACGKTLETTIEAISRKAEPVDIKDIGARFTTDIISSCAFGLECSSLQNPDDEFRHYGRKVFELSFFDGMKNFVGLVMPQLLQLLKLRVTKRDVSDFFMNIVQQTVDYREKNNVERNDMLNLLIKLKNNQSLDDDKPNGAKTEQTLSFNDLAAQCFVFFLAGFETSSTTMTFALFELCQNQDIQDKLRQEIKGVLAKHKGELTYEAIMEMTYMDKVVNETLRKHPALPVLNRTCNHEWQIPGTNTIIEKGTTVLISNYGMQMDPEYYPNPEKFDPERFSEEAKSKRPPCTYLPFGEGPRNCIGLRFGLLQSKVGLAMFLKNHKFTLDPKTILPIEYDTHMIILSHKHGIWLQCEKI